MIKKWAFLAILFGMLLNMNAQTNQKFETDNFSIKYPDLWQVTNDEGIINVYPDSEIGAITISGYKDLNLDSSQIKNLIISVLGSTEDESKISQKTSKGITEYYYQYPDEKTSSYWIAKVLEKENLIYLITINCTDKYWNGNFKNLFLETFNSFKLKK